VIILTSNIGSQYYEDKTNSKEDAKRQITAEIKKHFRPEFINRLDEIIVFNRLTEGDMLKIADLELDAIEKRLSERDISVKITVKAREALAKRGFDPDYGARPLKRLIQQEIQDRIALEILKGNISDGAKVNVDYDAKGKNFMIK